MRSTALYSCSHQLKILCLRVACFHVVFSRIVFPHAYFHMPEAVNGEPKVNTSKEQA
jgi:hypothetical protein